MQIIGLSGYARSGKDAAAEALKSLGFSRLAFADKLREFALTLDPVIIMNKSIANNVGMRLSEIIDEYGWDGYKDTIWSDDIRKTLQLIGTECGRRLIHDDVWIHATFNDLDYNGLYVVADVRFVNEAEYIRLNGGRIVRIVRDGVGPVNNHPSETALDNYRFDALIHNEGTLEEFQNTVREVISAGWN